ncbi:MAG: hypothetical protein RLZZ338_4810, partial [Cyanobacteriota bacterium]
CIRDRFYVIGGWGLLMDIISGVGRVFGGYLFVG